MTSFLAGAAAIAAMLVLGSERALDLESLLRAARSGDFDGAAAWVLDNVSTDVSERKGSRVLIADSVFLAFDAEVGDWTVESLVTGSRQELWPRSITTLDCQGRSIPRQGEAQGGIIVIVGDEYVVAVNMAQRRTFRVRRGSM